MCTTTRAKCALHGWYVHPRYWPRRQAHAHATERERNIRDRGTEGTRAHTKQGASGQYERGVMPATFSAFSVLVGIFLSCRGRYRSHKGDVVEHIGGMIGGGGSHNPARVGATVYMIAYAPTIVFGVWQQMFFYFLFLFL